MAATPNIRREGKAHNITVKMNGKTMILQTGKKRAGHGGFPTLIKTDSKELAKRAVDAFIPEPSSKGLLVESHSEGEDESEEGEDDDEESVIAPVLAVDALPPPKIEEVTESTEDDEDDDEEDDEEDSDEDEDDDLEDEEDPQEESRILNNPNATKLQAQYSNNFRVPDVYHHEKKPAPPVAPAPAPTRPAVAPTATAPVVENKMTKAKERSIKYVILWKISKVLSPEQRGDIDKLCTIDSSLEELQDIYNRLKKVAAQNSSLDMGKTVCTLATAGLEKMLLSQKLVDLSAMKGWSQSMNVVLEEGIMDGMLCEMLSDATENMSTMTRFMIAWAANGIGYYTSQQQAKGMMALQNNWGPYLNNNGGNLAGGTEFRAPPAPTAPVLPVPVPPPAQSAHHQPQRNANDLQRKLQEVDMLRKQQMHENMLQQHAKKMNSQAQNANPVVEQKPAAAAMNHHESLPPLRVIRAEEIDDYEEDHGSEQKEYPYGKRTREKTEEEDGTSDESSEDSSSGTSSPAPKRAKGNDGKSKTASLLRSPGLNAKIAKAFELQKRQLQAEDAAAENESQQQPPNNSSFAEIPYGSVLDATNAPFSPMRPQFQEGPEKPQNPRMGENLSMFAEPIAMLQPMY